MWLRLFCSEEMCVDLRPCHTAAANITKAKIQSVQKQPKQVDGKVHQPVFVHSLPKVYSCCQSTMLDLGLDLTRTESLHLILVCCDLQRKQMFLC